jgi:hypothetical protein
MPRLTKKEFYQELTSSDVIFTLEHLIIIFSLFEELIKEVSRVIYNEELKTYKWENIENFLKEKTILTNQELQELKLAKETRNCYVHNGNKIDDKWQKEYEKIWG